VGNLFDVKLRAIENLWTAGVSIVPVVTLINSVNNEQVGHLVRFALDNPGRIAFLSFQPVSFTGRDESVTGVGWRAIIEKMHMTATLTKWYQEHGRHKIYAGGKPVELATAEHTLVLDPAALYRQHVLKAAPPEPLIKIDGLRRASSRKAMAE